MRLLNLHMDLLRTFVTVVDLGGYTKAGHALGRTQPAISLQMRRLEELVGSRLITHEGRIAKLTADGEILISYAREILRLNDEAAAHFQRSGAEAALRIGLPVDYSVGYLQGLANEFLAAHPELTMEIRCDSSPRILDLLGSEEIDVAIATFPSASTKPPYLVRSWRETPVWATLAGSKTFARDPVPLIAHPEGCEYRARMIQALEAARRRWRLAFCSPDISDLQTAIGRGLGVTALTRNTLTPDMRVLTDDEGFPPLAEINVGLFYKPSRLAGVGQQLVEYLRRHIDEAGFCSPSDAATVRRVAAGG